MFLLRFRPLWTAVNSRWPLLCAALMRRHLRHRIDPARAVARQTARGGSRGQADALARFRVPARSSISTRPKRSPRAGRRRRSTASKPGRRSSQQTEQAARRRRRSSSARWRHRNRASPRLLRDLYVAGSARSDRDLPRGDVARRGHGRHRRPRESDRAERAARRPGRCPGRTAAAGASEARLPARRCSTGHAAEARAGERRLAAAVVLEARDRRRRSGRSALAHGGAPRAAAADAGAGGRAEARRRSRPPRSRAAQRPARCRPLRPRRAPRYPPPPAAGTRTLVVDAVAYHLAGPTASGLPVGVGVIAVDPAVIPLGTRVFVPGYGPAVAADVGVAVKGNIIDLWMPTHGAGARLGPPYRHDHHLRLSR